MKTLELEALNTMKPETLQSAVPGEFRPQKLPPTPWLSLGGYLDYSGWEERERFMELDRAIGSLAPHQREVARYCRVLYSVRIDTQPDERETINCASPLNGNTEVDSSHATANSLGSFSSGNTIHHFVPNCGYRARSDAFSRETFWPLDESTGAI
jgi:hypothetical protein